MIKFFLGLFLLPILAQAQAPIFGTPGYDLPFRAASPSSSASSCTTSNLWSTPILQAMTIIGGDGTSLGANAYGCQKIHNTSSVAVTIKSVLWYTQWNNATLTTVFAKCRTSFNTTLGSDIGVASQSVTTNNANANPWVAYVWTAGTEPVIPANTDFYIGIINAGGANNITIVSRFAPGGTSYQDNTYFSYANNVAVDANDDANFQIFICP